MGRTDVDALAATGAGVGINPGYRCAANRRCEVDGARFTGFVASAAEDASVSQAAGPDLGNS
ncbi:MAG: hypothetical protein QGH93_09815 [Gammaproteobacteria bacterium]|nr:hypothetical protein [Gammaproteobacteria bacterium]